MGFQRELGGEPIPGYRLIERLGGGGFGEVWKVEAPGGILKALKFVYGDIRTTSEEGHRAEQELKALNRVKTVRHPYVLSLERYDIIEGQLMIIMELADKNLWDRYRECKAQGGSPGIPREELMRYMEETAEALDLMNIEYQLQHLDIKPQNLFVVHQHVKVADFGLVKDLEGMVASVTGGVTPVYAAPETFDGMVTRFCDQYSLAIVYQELLTGQRPFSGTNIHQLVMQHVQGKPNLSPLLPGDQEVIARSLSKNPDERYPNCSEMVRCLKKAEAKNAGLPAADEPKAVVVRPAAEAPPPPPPPPRGTPVPEEGTTTLPVSRPAREVANERAVPTPAPPTPHSVTDSKRGGGTITAPPPPIEPAVKQAPPEVTGDGTLFPALIIGIGEMGAGVIQKLRAALRDSFRAPESLPNIRMLAIDTDAEGIQAPPKEGHGMALTPNEIVLARLNRPIHYLKPRDGRPKIDVWFNTNMLYRIQRNLTTGGLRALGRLALVDNYRTIVQRLRGELEACLEPDSIAKACKKTGQKLRSNRPRVYVVTSLTGGTGSGMFIDIAYIMRAQLRQLGYSHPDVVGVFLVPGADKESLQRAGNSKSMVNAFASLTELNHYSAPDVIFTARYEEREATLTDKGAPFRRSILLPLPPEGSDTALWNQLGLAADYLCRDLTSPLGRAADTGRNALPPPEPGTPLGLQTFGMVRISWPRRTLLERSGRHFCKGIVERWSAKEVRQGRERIAQWVKEQWDKKELSAEAQIDRVQFACEQVLGKRPESVFTEIYEPLVPRGWFAGAVKAPAVRDAVEKITGLLGKPTSSAVLYKPGTLEETIRSEGETLAEEWEKKILELTGRLIEQPEFLLPGAEEALRCFIALIDNTLKHKEPLNQELSQKTAIENERLQILLENVEEISAGGRRAAQFQTELLELIKIYPRDRYQSMVLKVVLTAYTAMRGKLSDQLREIGYARNRLAELVRGFDTIDAQPEERTGPQLLPVGAESVDDAVERFVGAISNKDLDDLAKKMHHVVQEQFRGLMHVCSSPASMMKNLEAAMLHQAIKFAESRLEGYDIVEMYMARYPDDRESRNVLAKTFDDAAPLLIGPNATSRTELCVFACPSGPNEGKLRDLASRAVPEAELIPCATTHDIIVYREEARLPIDKVTLLGATGHEAYNQANVAENFTTHTRTDIEKWHEVAPG
jgi:serine/threonine protein kinase